MMTDEEMKKQIDGMTLLEMLKLWRWADSECEMLTGKMRDYFTNSMDTKRQEMTTAEWKQLSDEFK